MNAKELWETHSPKLRKLIERYKWILLVIAAGAFLLLLPTGGAPAERTAEPQMQQTEAFDLTATEARFAAALSEIAGAGEVIIVLSVRSGTRQIIAEDSRISEGGSGYEEESSAVLISRGSGVQETVRLQELYPQFQGALIICDGGNDPMVRLKLTEATAALTGLGADKISICSRGK